MKNYAYEYRECEGIPNIRILDKAKSHKADKKIHELKDYCKLIALAWTLGMSFMLPMLSTNEAVGQAVGVFLMISAILQLVGW